MSLDPGPVAGALVAAVGLPLGEAHSDDPEALGGCAVVRGAQLLELSTGAYTVWTGGLAPRTAAQLVEWGRWKGVDGSGELVDELLADGLLVELPDAAGPARAFAGSHRLLPQGIGNGNTAGEPGVYTLGDRMGEPLLTVDAGVYHVWALSSGAPTLAGAVASVAALMGVAPEDLLRSTLEALPLLMQARLVCLDRPC